MASKLEQACTRAQASVPDCVATGYVDMGSGMLLGAKTVDSHPREVLDLVAAATADLFQGTNVSSIEKLFRKSRGVKDDGAHYFQEMIVMSDNLVHVFLRSKRNSEQAAVFVCRKSVNIGMALTKSRLSLPDLESNV
ncbi:hypothetical protein [Frigoriglobus tundricola]|uniref:Roadblock/LAMTOR2 domain-containing protein n=1 Tax=Frigoriglobus tundricola TaxID=2774151 RepID=A0A6M5YLC6_9BACT|nr:hypothetical protein [Frigoriglobus tundricola]QJW94778.1 hypothetical protein FTUN_2301 [Frigoriglobus tundricola]